MSIDDRKLSVADDERVRAIRDRISAAKTRVEIALEYVMYPEVREELRNVKSDLALALAHIGP
jgi:hypothetical protein